MKKRRKGPSDQKPVQAEPAKGGWRAAVSGIKSNAEAACLWAARLSGFSRLPPWLLAYFHPGEAQAIEAGSATLDRIAMDLLSAYFIYAVVALLTGAYALYYSAGMQEAAASYGYETPEPYVFALGTLVASPIINTATALVLLAMIGWAARLLSGKAEIAKQARALSLIFCGGSVISTVLFIPLFAFSMLGASIGEEVSAADFPIAMLSLGGMMACMLALLLVFAWLIYGYFRAVKEMNGFSGYRALAVILIAAIAVIAIDALARGALGIGF